MQSMTLEGWLELPEPRPAYYLKASELPWPIVKVTKTRRKSYPYTVVESIPLDGGKATLESTCSGRAIVLPVPEVA